MKVLGDLLVEAKPGFACGKEDPAGVFQFRMNNISKSSDLVLTSRRRVPPDAHRQIDRFSLKAGDVLFNATNSPDGVGKSVLVPELDEPAVFSNHFLRLRVDAEHLAPAYLWRWLQFKFQCGVFLGLTRQWVNQGTVGRDDLLRLPLEPPPLQEQLRIAAILNQSDALRAKRRGALADLDSLAQAIFQDEFGALSPTSTLKEAGTEFRYGTSNKSGPGGRPTLRIPNVIGGELDLREIKTVNVKPAELERLKLRKGDLLFVRSNGNPDNVGRSAVFDPARIAPSPFGDDDWIYASYLIRARLARRLSPVFLAAYLTSPPGRRQLRDRAKTSAGQFNINTDGLGSIRVPLPVFGRQEQFEAQVFEIGEKRVRLERALAADEELFASLQARAFLGEL